MSAVQFNDQCHQLELTRLNTHAKRWCQVCDNTRINNWRIFFRTNPLKCYLNWKICANRLSDIGQCKRRSNAKSVLRVTIKWKSASPGQGRKNNENRGHQVYFTTTAVMSKKVEKIRGIHKVRTYKMCLWFHTIHYLPGPSSSPKCRPSHTSPFSFEIENLPVCNKRPVRCYCYF